MIDHSASTDVPIKLMLMNVSRELDSLGACADSIQDAVSPALAPTILAHPSAMAGLQDLDRLSQTLKALSSFVLTLAGRVEPSAAASADLLAIRLPLADLARRLGAKE